MLLAGTSPKYHHDEASITSPLPATEAIPGPGPGPDWGVGTGRRGPATLVEMGNPILLLFLIDGLLVP
ncbi:uncharacterized protein ColSpa_06889 [Colletotrichum spaethianum]|uniref:Uncharacterized protein n=1 Tax=Colletotrichum spaethianum TaxID=700344 RepID=A0AA37LE21_9PEZI|nr:uncharacterized protein ColSpa_06889 [Colletotrichum spaethianum]GKT46708.1 hypothetical protein ColSpa_06889 [Colletotrichum spaethianum]